MKRKGWHRKLEKEQDVNREWSFLRHSEENIVKVDEILEQGRFPGGLLIDDHRVEGKAGWLTIQLVGETTAKRNMEKIWTCLEKGETQSIGVLGMGGVGKTTIITRSTSVVNDIAEWRSALNELRGDVKGHTIDMENDVFEESNASRMFVVLCIVS